MKRYVMLGTEEPEHKDSERLTYKGVYSAKWTNPPDNQNLYLSAYPDIRLETDDQFRTPRSLMIKPSGIYILTKSHIFSQGNLTEKSERRLIRDFLGNDQDLVQLIDQAGTMGNFVDLKNKGVLLAIYLSDSARREAEERGQLKRTGFLLHSPTESLNDLYLLDELNPTGMVNLLDEDEKKTLLVPNRNSLEYHVHQHVQEQGKFRFNKARRLILKDDVIEARYLNGFTVCFDNSEGYTIDYRGKNQYFARTIDTDHFNPDSKSNLLAQASSLGMISHEKNVYALFGMEDGKISIFRLGENKGVPYSQYINTVNFISLEKEIREQSNDIKNIKTHDVDYVSFTLRNLYLRIGIKKIIEHNGGRIRAEDEVDLSDYKNDEREVGEKKSNPQDRMESYLNALKKEYRLDCAWGVPHHIRTWDSGEK